MSRPSTQSSSTSKSYDWLFPHEHPLHHMNSFGTVHRAASPVSEVRTKDEMSTRKRVKTSSRPSASTSRSYDWLFPHSHSLHHVNSYGNVHRAASPVPEVKMDGEMSTRKFVKAVLRRIVVLEV